MRFLIKISILLCTFDCFAQFDWNSKSWNKESLGFGCSVTGEMTKPVHDMTLWLMEKRFDRIRQQLNSDIPTNRFLGAFTLEKLSARNELTISDHELERIKEIKESDEMVPFCSGCTLWTEIPLKELFVEKSNGLVFASADHWFKHYYNIYYKKRRKNRDN